MDGGGEAPALRISVGCLTCVAMSRGNKCWACTGTGVLELHLGKTLSNGKLQSMRRRSLLVVGSQCLLSSHPSADCPSLPLGGRKRNLLSA